MAARVSLAAIRRRRSSTPRRPTWGAPWLPCSPRKGWGWTSRPAASWRLPGAAGFPMERVYLHGNNKSPQELREALDGGRRPRRRRQLPRGGAAGRASAASWASGSRCSCASRRTSTRTPTATSPPARSTRKFGVPIATGQAEEAVAALASSTGAGARRPARAHRLADLRDRAVPADRPGRSSSSPRT